MKLSDVFEQQYLYHLGANIPTRQLNPLTFFTNDKRGAESFAQVASYDTPKLHRIINNITKPAREADVLAAAYELGVFEKGTQTVDYLTTHYWGKDAIRIAQSLRKKGFDGAVLKDVAANQQTRIISYIPFNRLTARVVG